MTKIDVFTVVNSLLETKDHLTESDINMYYEPWIVNKAVSMHIDTVMYANEMNQKAFLDKDQQYEYYYTSIRKKKRYSKWQKKTSKEESLDNVKRYFNYNDRKAIEALRILTDDDIERINSAFREGGERK